MAAPGKVRLLFLLVTFGTGGSERVVLDLCRHLDQERFEPSVAAFHDGPLRAHFERLGVRATVVVKRPGLDFGLMRKLAALVAEQRPQVVNTHHFVTLFYAFWGCKLRGRCATFHTEHSVWELEQLEPHWKVVSRRLMRRCDGTIAVSRAVHEHLCGLKTRSHFIPNGIDLALFGRSANGAKRVELGLTEADKVVGVVGNLRPEKDHLGLLRAFKRVAAALPGARLVVVGDGVMRGALHEEARALGLEGRVHFLGQRFDAPELYGAFDVYCLPSRHEGMPLTLLEAMASGLPLAGTDVMGIGELVRESGAGLLAAHGDEGQLAEALIRLLQDKDLAARLGRSGLDYVRREHDLEKTIRRYEALFSSGAS